MIPLLEGSDGAGKSRLADRLQDVFGLEVIHFSSPKAGVSVFDHHFGPVKGMSGGVIIDRLHISDDVYGKTLRGAPGLTDAEFGYIDGWLLARHCIVILCSPPLAAVTANVLAAPERENHSADVAEKIWRAYRRRDFRTMLPILAYDYTQDPAADAVIKKLNCWANDDYKVKLCPACARKFILAGRAAPPYCAECAAVYTARRRHSGQRTAAQSSRHSKKAAALRYRYGIGEAQFSAIGDAQGWRCAICAVDIATVPCVDHDHKTGKVRGLLCASCNRGIGLLKEDIVVLEAAVKYIENGGTPC